VITLVCWLVSITGTAAVALMGTSAAVAAVPGDRAWPPYSLSLAPGADVVYAVEVLAVAAGAMATWRLLSAARRNTGPDPRRLLTGGILAAAGLTLLPPTGSADLLSYLAYGAEGMTGVNPYTHGPQSAGVLQDAITRAVDPPWQTTPSVYGPVFTRISIGIAHLARADGHISATLTRLILLGAFAVTGVVLHRLAAGEAARRRSAALWSANPLMISALIAGAHVDVLVAAAVVCALALVGRSALAAGVTAGVAATLKLTGVLVLPGLLWAVRARRRSVLAVLLGAGGFALPWYAATRDALDQVRHVGQYTTPAAPWRVVRSALEPWLGVAAARATTPLLAGAVGLAVIALLLRRGLPAAAGVSPLHRAAAVTATISVGWLLTAPYVLPWYDAVGWAALALVGASLLDRVLVIHTAALSYALLPGREVPLPATVEGPATILHEVASPLVLLGLLLVVVTAALRRPPVAVPPAVEPSTR
jgi:hypothetical protein